MPASTDKQPRFRGADVERKREGMATTGISESPLDVVPELNLPKREAQVDSPAVHQGEAGDKPDRP